SSINKIVPGTEAFIHLHLWNPQLRRGGLGTEFVRKSATFYFERFDLKKIVCEPSAANPSPNRVLEKLGFEFVRRYKTIPTEIAYEQEVNRYEVKRPESNPRGGNAWPKMSEAERSAFAGRRQRLHNQSGGIPI